MQKIIILAAARSGTNYLRSLLKSHPNIRMSGEIFRQKWEFPGYCKNFYTTPEEKALILKLRFDDPHLFLNKYIWSVRDPAISLVGFKLLYGQGCDAEGSKNKVAEYLRDCKNLKIIHLKRRNFLKREISLVHAKRSGEWSVKKNQNGFSSLIRRYWLGLKKFRAVSLGAKECENFFLRNEKMILDYDDYFKNQQILSIYYEDLIAFFDENINKIMTFLDVDIYPLKSPFLKQNPLPLRWSLRNYEKLKKHFKGTRWESFFLE